MPLIAAILGPSGRGLTEFAWHLASATGAAWVANDAAVHISLLRSTVRQELAVPLEQRGIPRADMATRVDTALAAWGLDPVATHNPLHLSTGQTRRMAIAAALLPRPHALVLDCPTDGLDREAIAQLAHTIAAFDGPVVILDRVPNPLIDASIPLWTLDAAAAAPHSAAAPVTAYPAPTELSPAAFDAHPLLHRIPLPPAPTLLPAGGGGGARSGEDSRGRGRDAGGGETLIDLSELWIPRAERILGPLSLRARRGVITHLAGPNGAGKTSLMLAAQGLIPSHRGAAAGAAEVGRARGGEGAMLASAREVQRPPVACGWVPTAVDAALTQRTVERECALGASAEQAAAAMRRLGVEECAQMHPLDVPASRRRLVLVAAALARGPEVLFLDEPTVGLDAEGYATLGRVMAECRDAGMAVVWTCHDEALAASVSDEQQRVGD